MLSYAQNDLYRKRYMEAAGAGAVLFNGRSAPYYPYVYTNSHYAFGDLYQPGTLICDGIRYDDVLMNLDSHFDCLCVRSSLIAPMVCVEKDKVTEFSYGGHTFINLVNKYHEVDGYVEVLGRSGEMVLVRKLIKRPLEDVSGVVVVRFFRDEESFWLINGESAKQITSHKSFFDLYPEKKKVLKSTWRSMSYLQQDDYLCSYPLLFKVVAEK